MKTDRGTESMSNSNEPIRVLVVNSGSKLFGGVSSFLYNVYTHLDRTRVQYDFLSPNQTTYEIHRAEIEAMGGRIYALGITGNLLSKKTKLYSRLKAFLKAHPYRIVHLNSGDFYFNLFAGKAARDAGVETVIVHSHSVGNPQDSPMKRRSIRLMKPALERQAKAFAACSPEAAEFMFTHETVAAKRVDIVPNGIEVGKYGYDPRTREAIRRELKLEDKVVLGHVGRLAYPKNQAYLVELLAEYRKRRPNAVLMLIGEGDHKESLQALARERGVSDAVIFTGARTDVERYYQAMDVFLFPSFYEGFGMVLVEAQIAGLSCLASACVPRSTDIIGNTAYIGIEKGDIPKWIDALELALDRPRQSHVDLALAAGFDINTVAERLCDKYVSLYEGKR